MTDRNAVGASWEKCGGCGLPARLMVPDEAAEVVRRAASDIAYGHDPIRVLDGLLWASEHAAMWDEWSSLGAFCKCRREDRLRLVPDSGFHVYRLFDANDRLLYVGMSRRLRGRLREHYADRGQYVARHEYQPCQTEAEMVDLERHLIQTLHPPLNSTLNGGA